MKKFELTNEFIANRFGTKLFRIRALVEFGDVEAGELGGYVEKESNLGHDDNAWVYGNARVYGDALVYDNARVYDNAWVYGNAQVSGNALVYGGSKSGLMGLLADSVLAAGGRVTGVEPKCFLDAELQHEGLTELIVTEDMPARKTRMIELGDAFIAFPGGTGTLEEITEVISKLSLGQLDAPCILYDLNGYYQPLHQLLQQMITMGLSTPARQRNITFAADLAQIRAILEK